MPAAGFTADSKVEREGLLRKLKTMLDNVPGTETPWEAIETRLRKFPLADLNGLHYRVERAIAGAFDDGLNHGKAAGDCARLGCGEPAVPDDEGDALWCSEHLPK